MAPRFDRSTSFPFDLDAYLERLTTRRELLSEDAVRAVCARLKEILARESNVKHIQSPVAVVGDVHGQFYDVLEIFRIGGPCPSTNYLFLGDYVDRGYFSVETMTLLACLKLRYPDRITLLRGNHESRAVTQVYGFYSECMRKYGTATVWSYFMDMFDFMTLSVVIDDRIFCTHGGLSPFLPHIDQIKILDRFGGTYVEEQASVWNIWQVEIPHEGAIADLMWSDPEPKSDGFKISPRGAGFTFGSQVVRAFLHTNQMQHILRAHQLCMEGFQVLFDDTLSTVWSAPNYCYRCGNVASILEVDEHAQRRFNVFGPAPDQDRQIKQAEEQQRNGQQQRNGSVSGADVALDTVTKFPEQQQQQQQQQQLLYFL